jgi:centromeric protein E
MDVSRVDPEDVLVDWETVEPADISGEVDENLFRAALNGNNDDKVLVSVRVRPSEAPSAWDTQVNAKSIKLLPQHHRNAATTPPVFHFDEILTGSDNKLVYNTIARNHVCAAMDGYNSVIFAYGQTASGKTFTLVCHYRHPVVAIYSYTSTVWRRRPARNHTTCHERCLCFHPTYIGARVLIALLLS